MPQTPAEQRAVPLGAVQVRPQAPQLVTLVARSTHATPHIVYGQIVVQAPRTHDCPLAQRVPHAPQFAGSALVLASQPLAALPSQLP